jgi:hypothetical protein
MVLALYGFKAQYREIALNTLGDSYTLRQYQAASQRKRALVSLTDIEDFYGCSDDTAATDLDAWPEDLH